MFDKLDKFVTKFAVWTYETECTLPFMLWWFCGGFLVCGILLLRDKIKERKKGA